MSNPPSFFKLFIEELNAIDMEIPIPFIHRMKESLPGKVYLRDRNNKLWIVKVAKVGDMWFFLDGWENFVEDNSLATGDLLVFKYASDHLLNVKIYGPNATEKNGTGPSAHRGVENQEQVSEDHDVENENKNEDNIDEEIVVQPQVSNDGAVAGSSRRQRLVHLNARCYGMEIFQAGLAEQPTNPYFVAKIMPKRTGDLFIPKDVIVDHNLNLGEEVILVDPNGKEFNAKCRRWTDGRSLLSKGWKRLCRVNGVLLEDKCICEFVKREGDERYFLHINFVRNANANQIP